MQDLPQIRKSRLPYSRQWVDQKDIDEVTKVLKSDWLTQGPKVKEFEKEFADFVGAKFKSEMTVISFLFISSGNG